MDQTVADTVSEATLRLLAAGVETARLDAELLLAHLLKYERMALLMRTEPLDRATVHALEKIISRRADGEPVAYIIGVQAFWQHDFNVNTHTLVPRQDTETLVEVVLRGLSSVKAPNILDMGTGSGCILLSLLAEFESATGVGLDISAEALAVAEKNASKIDLSDRAEFLQSDWFDSLKPGEHRFDSIVCNPPYIPSQDIKGLMKEVRMHEPRAALDGGLDGLGPYRVIAKEASAHLVPGGLLAVEVGTGQAQEVAAFFEASGFNQVEIFKDLPGLDRVVSARNLKS